MEVENLSQVTLGIPILSVSILPDGLSKARLCGGITNEHWNTPAPSGSVWTVPFGGGVGRITKLGFQRVNINVQAYGNAVHVPGASPWTVRATFALLFPKLTKQQQKMLLEQKLKQMDEEPTQK